MDIISKVREIGVLIQEDERYKAYHASKAANDLDEELQNKIGEFNLKRVALNSEMSKPDGSQEKIAEYNAEIKAMYGEIMTNPNMVSFNNAKQAMDSMLNQINMVITMSANGEDPMTCPTEQPASSCGGSCSSCSTGCN